MASNTLFEEDKARTEQVAEMINNVDYREFDPLRTYGAKVLVVRKEKTDKDDNEVACGAPTDVKQVKGFLQAVLDYHFVLIFDRYVFDAADQQAQAAMFHRALCSMGLDEKGPFLRKPDVIEYAANIGRYGDLIGSLSQGLRRAISLTGRDLEEILHLEDGSASGSETEPEPEDEEDDDLSEEI